MPTCGHIEKNRPKHENYTENKREPPCGVVRTLADKLQVAQRNLQLTATINVPNLNRPKGTTHRLLLLNTADRRFISSTDMEPNRIKRKMVLMGATKFKQSEA